MFFKINSGCTLTISFGVRGWEQSYNNINMGESIVRVQNLSHRYSVQWAIRDISFEIKQKGVLGLLGSNGAGKSTTMNIMCGVLNQTEGEVYINGVNLREDPVGAKRHIGFLPQKPPLYTDFTVDEYLVYCAKLRLMDIREIRPAVDRAKEKCQIAHFSKRLIRNLSGGYQQRVGIAQAIVHNPLFVVLDEPTNGLDPNQIMEIRHLIQEIAVDRAVMLSTHILSEVQATCDEIKMIEHGQMVFSGTLREFNNYMAPSTFVMTLENPPSIKDLRAIPGITEVEELTSTRFRMHFAGEPDITKRMTVMSVNAGWRMSEIILERDSLDTVFAQLSGKKSGNK